MMKNFVEYSTAIPIVNNLIVKTIGPLAPHISSAWRNGAIRIVRSARLVLFALPLYNGANTMLKFCPGAG
jgi:hypothetical protein